jgi:hypothetical protein
MMSWRPASSILFLFEDIFSQDRERNLMIGPEEG